MRPLRPIQQDFYGDDYRWFFGTVINSHPPAGLEGRVKVRIYGIHNPDTEAIPERDLPWAQVLVPTTEGGVSGLGRTPQIEAGAFVFGVFMDGISSQLPLVLGSLPRVEFPSSIQSDKINPGGNAFNYEQDRLQNVVITSIAKDDEPSPSVALRRQQSMKFFIDNGYELIHAAAITGSLQAGSNFQTFGQAGTFGIAKWKQSTETGSRYNDLIRFSGQFSPTSNFSLYSIQLQFVLYELRGRFNNANSLLISTTDIESASAVMDRYYIKRKTSTAKLAETAYDEVLV